VVQVVIYIGAIAILFIFAVMLTRRDMRDRGPQMNRSWWLGAIMSLLTFIGLFFFLSSWDGYTNVAQEMPAAFDTMGKLGDCFLPTLTFCRSRIRTSFSRPGWRGVCRLHPEIGAFVIPLSWYLTLSAALFSIGLFGVLTRRNAIAILLGIELMLNAVNVNLAAFWRYGDVNQMTGQVFAIMFCCGCRWVAVGLALVISVYRKKNTVSEEIDLMKG
jgi:NADH-quinone oxidoreductase subunit K